MTRHPESDDPDGVYEPMTSRTRRNRLPEPHDDDGADDFTHQDLIECLRGIDGLELGRGAHVNFTFRTKPFLHFHDHDGRIHADVKFGSGDFHAMPASTPAERRSLLARVERHVQKIHRTRKGSKPARRDS